ncbi:MAG: hypothetical protein ACRD8O_15340 [Bryobacteraceae bacterium]
MSYESTRAIALKLRGETPARAIDSGAALVRKPDLESPDVRALLFRHPEVPRRRRVRPLRLKPIARRSPCC